MSGKTCRTKKIKSMLKNGAGLASLAENGNLGNNTPRDYTRALDGAPPYDEFQPYRAKRSAKVKKPVKRPKRGGA